MIPRLETERLILRPARFEDWPAYRDFMASERATGLGGPFKMEVAWGMFCHDTAIWDLFGHGGLMLESKETSACLGQVGINAGPLFPETEIGWYLYPEAEGQGFAYEAASTLLHWGFKDFGLDTLVSYVEPDNHRSRTLAERLGGLPDNNAPRPDPWDIVYRHPKLA